MVQQHESAPSGSVLWLCDCLLHLHSKKYLHEGLFTHRCVLLAQNLVALKYIYTVTFFFWEKLCKQNTHTIKRLLFCQTDLWSLQNCNPCCPIMRCRLRDIQHHTWWHPTPHMGHTVTIRGDQLKKVLYVMKNTLKLAWTNTTYM